MNKVVAGSVLVGALLFGGGAGAMITNTVAEHKAEEVEAKHLETVNEMNVNANEQVKTCQNALRLADSGFLSFVEYFEASNAYVASLPHPGFELDQNLADKTEVIRTDYILSGWGDGYRQAKVDCGFER